MLDQYHDRWALITGASSGIGKEFAEMLAARGMHLVLVARREELLQELAKGLDTRHGSQTLILPYDLSQPDSVQHICETLSEQDLSIELLVNNAGFACVSSIENMALDRIMEMIRLNIGALTELSHRFLPSMIERQHGAIINISSVAAFQPVAYMGAYAATKAYVLHYSEALWAEARDHNVTVMALCPGVTKTEFFEVAGVSGWLKKQRSHSPEQVVRTALKYLEKNKQYVIPGWKNYLVSLLVRLAPRRTAVLESRKYFRPQKRSKSNDQTESESSVDKDPDASS